MGLNPAEDIYFHFEFSFPSRSKKLSGINANEIRHDNSHEGIFVLDLRYYLSYNALYTYSCSIAIKLVRTLLNYRVLGTITATVFLSNDHSLYALKYLGWTSCLISFA